MQEQEFSILVRQESSQADFGDARLTARLRILRDALSRNPQASLPKATGSVGDLEATYRFLGNPKVTPEKILEPHFSATAERSKKASRIVVAHDSSNLLFGGKDRREEIGWLNQNNVGFMGHFALAVERELLVRPLGLLGMKAVFRQGQPKRTKSRRKKDPTRESLRWWELAKEVDNRLSLEVCALHVMDREADDFELFANLVTHQMRFVIRCRQDRTKCKHLGKTQKKTLYEIIGEAKPIGEREIFLSNREFNRLNAKRGTHKPRGARKASVKISASAIKFPRPTYVKNGPEFLYLNCVHVYEPSPPAGEEPVDWKLLTTEPVDELQDILMIIDDYRARWMIEEYFKALKTGCSYEKRQLETKESLLNILAVLAPIAWQLLALRTLSREIPEASATYALTKNQIELLRAVSKKPLPEQPTVSQAMLAIAALGGHIPNNGDPGWVVLNRGMVDLLTMEIAWNAATKRCDQS